MGNSFFSDLKKVLNVAVNEILENLPAENDSNTSRQATAQASTEYEAEPAPTPESPDTESSQPQEKKEYTRAEIDAFHAAHPDALLIVDDVFTISGRGIVVCGLTKAHITSNRPVTVYRLDGSQVTSYINGIEQFRNLIDEVGPGENVGVLLRGIERTDIARFDVLV